MSPWFVVTAASAADLCPDDVPDAVDAAISTLYEAYRSVDEAAFDRTQKQLVAAVACLDSVPTGPQIARLHQGMALSAFVNGQSRAARRALATARMMDPGWRLEERMFPPTHPFVDLYASAGDPGPIDRLGAIKPEVWVVDGYEALEAPVDRAFLLQVKRDGAVVWSGYVFDWAEIPDRGQASTRDTFDAPHALTIAMGAAGRFLSSRQVSTSAAWDDQRGATAGGGLTALARFTPVSVFAVEGTASLLAPVDPIARGGGQPSLALVVVAGVGGWVGDLQPHGGVRVGSGWDRLRAWPADGSDVPAPSIESVGSAVLGLEGGVRAAGYRGALAGDFLLAGLTSPFQLRLRLDGGATLGAGPLALEGLFEVRTGGLRYADGPRDAGRRSDLDLRLGVALAWWR